MPVHPNSKLPSLHLSLVWKDFCSLAENIVLDKKSIHSINVKKKHKATWLVFCYALPRSSTKKMLKDYKKGKKKKVVKVELTLHGNSVFLFPCSP